MALPILAHWAGRSIFDIEPAALARRGIRLLLADLDNTLAPYGEPEPTQAVRDWAAALGEQGITLFVLSNNRHPERPRRFSQALGVPFLGHAGKPKPGGFRRAMEQMSCTPEQTAIVGDQLFTDILGGRNAGVLTLLVEPTQAVRDWAAALGEQGITLFVLSNNRHPERPRRFSQALGVPFLGHAGKPKPGGFRRAMEQMSCTPEQTAIVGDQLFTDILGGRNAGVLTLLVEPIRLAGNPGRYLRYGAEWPFRMWSKRRTKPL